jgi:hypothetical protein
MLMTRAQNTGRIATCNAIEKTVQCGASLSPEGSIVMLTEC